MLLVESMCFVEELIVCREFFYSCRVIWLMIPHIARNYDTRKGVVLV